MLRNLKKLCALRVSWPPKVPRGCVLCGEEKVSTLKRETTKREDYPKKEHLR